MNEHRRNFIKKLCLSCGSVLILPACAREISLWRFFSEQEARLVISIAEQIIPADRDPGATDANVINYIDKQIVGPMARFQEDYRQGLAAIEKTCNRLFKSSFKDLGWDQQTKFLSDMEQGKVLVDDWDKQEQRSFFRLILDHSMQGFYGSPRHGGNCNYVSYKMMKLDYPHVIGQNRYDDGDLIQNQQTL